MFDYLSYAHEKLGLAVYILVGAGDYRQRMLDADHHLHVLMPEHMPEDLAPVLERYREVVFKQTPSGTLPEIPPEDYEEKAQLVVKLYEEVLEREAGEFPS